MLGYHIEGSSCILPCHSPIVPNPQPLNFDYYLGARLEDVYIASARDPYYIS